MKLLFDDLQTECSQLLYGNTQSPHTQDGPPAKVAKVGQQYDRQVHYTFSN